MSNPLSAKHDLPPYIQIKAEHIKPAIKERLEFNREIIKTLLNKNHYTFNNLVLPLEHLSDELHEMWGIVKHLNSVKDIPEWRAEHDAVLPLVTDYYIEIHQHEGLFEAFQKLRLSIEFEKLNPLQKKVVENYLKDFKLSGVSLSKKEKEQYKIGLERLSELKNKFSHHVLDARDNWFLLITDKSRLQGLPEHTINQAKMAAEQNKQSGWRLTLDYPCYSAIMSYADDRSLREEVYYAYNTLASDQNPAFKQWDNGPLMVEQLKIKQHIARLLGYSSYAEYSLAKKMLKDPTQVLTFLNDLLGPLKNKGLKDIEMIKDFAKHNYGWSDIKPWDLRFLSEKLLEQNFSFSEEELRKYFPETHVLQGLFSVVHTLFNVSIKEVKNVEVWDPCVKFFAMFDQNDTLVGRFYMDLYARPHKRAGAWCGTCKNRIEKQEGMQTPVAYVVANFRPATDEEQEAYLSHNEVITLFHEFGHCLHFIFSNMPYPTIGADYGVSWDAIELPSQLMENWCWENEVIFLLSKHSETGQPLPDDLISKLKNSKNYLIGIHMLRQLEFALFDFELHLKANLERYSDIQEVLNNVRENTAVIPLPSFNRFQNSFSHIFAGGYAAGYYSYLWSEVLSADTYTFFKENNNVFDQRVAKRYVDTILKPGGSKEFMELFIAFRGRPPRVEALLGEWGL